MTKFVQKLDASFLTPYREATPPFGPCGYVTAMRTYARKIDEECECPKEGCRASVHRIEAWHEVVARCVNALGAAGAWTRQELEELYYFWFNLKAMGGGRHNWQLGTKAVQRFGADSLNNCWFVALDNLHAFEFGFDQLMLGGGVGFSVRAEHIYKLPKVKHQPDVREVESFDCDLIVTDNREGWVELLHQVLNSFFHEGKRLHYNVKCLREKGKRIKTFGGTTSGGQVLVDGIQKIVSILRGAFGRNLTDVECVDIGTLIGAIVVAGNVRRSAIIMIGDHNSQKFLDAKNWTKGPVPSWRARSNNTVACTNIAELPETFWENYNGEGEPVGLFNVNVARNYGRLIDGRGYRPDPGVEGLNPCGEITLEPWEACNLADIILPNLANELEFFTAAKLLTKVCKTVSCIRHKEPETREVVERNHRLGVGITGFLQALHFHDEKLFSEVYHEMEATDRAYSKLMGVTPSNKLTTFKPSGTLSTVAGCTPGAHPGFGRYYIRRIEFASDDVLIDLLRKHGHWIEPKLNMDGTRDERSMIVEFPCETPAGAVLEEDMTAVQQMETQLWAQTHWADNSVSFTVKYDAEELPAMRRWLAANYDDRVKSISFLLRGDASGFKQMPYETITKEEYEAMRKGITPVTSGAETFGSVAGIECDGGACPVR